MSVRAGKEFVGEVRERVSIGAVDELLGTGKRALGSTVAASEIRIIHKSYGKAFEKATVHNVSPPPESTMVSIGGGVPVLEPS